jgi:hypothetical protein
LLGILQKLFRAFGKKLPKPDSPKAFAFRRLWKGGGVLESLEKEGTGGSLIIFKMFEERNRRVFDYFQNVWRKEPGVL